MKININSLSSNRYSKIIVILLFSLTFLLISSTYFNTVRAQSIVFIEPNSSTVWQQGQTVTIRWGNSSGDCATDPENPYNIRPDLNLLKEDTGFIYRIISRFELVNCSIVWHIPTNLTDGNDYQISFFYYGEMPGTAAYSWKSELFTIGPAGGIPAYSVFIILSIFALASSVIIYSINKKKLLKKI